MDVEPAIRSEGEVGGYAAAATRGTVWMTAQTVLNKSVTTVAGLVLARLLSPADYGIAFFVVNVVVFVFVFPVFVMGDVLLVERRRFNEVAGAATVVMWIAAAAMFVVLSCAATPLERHDGRAGVALLVLVAATRPIADAVLVIANARMRIDLEYKRIAIIDGSVTLAATIGCLAMAYFGSGPLALNVPPIAAIAVRGLLYWRVVYRRVDLTVNRTEIKPIARRFMAAGLGQYINNILLALEIVVLGFATDETEVGLFVLAATYAIQANSVIAGQIGAVLQPIFAHVQDEPARQVGGFLRATRLLSAIAVPLSLVQAAIAIPLFHLLFPPKWTGSIAIFAVLSVAQAFVFVSAPSIALLKAQGRFRAFLKLQWAQLVTASLGFCAAVMYGGPMALRFASSLGLPVDENAGKALALSLTSAVVWAMFCPLAVWIGGRPARLGRRAALRVFLEPWLVALPVCLLLVAAWIGMRHMASTTLADVSTLAVLAPLAAATSIAGCVWMRADTRSDAQSVLAELTARRKPRG